MTRHALRPATSGDLDFLRRVHAEAMRPHIERTWGAWDDAEQRRRLLETTRPESHEIIELDAEPIGCRWVRAHPDSLELVRLWLLPHAQRKGIGAALVRDLLAAAARARLPVRLRVLKVNPAGHRPDERNGRGGTAGNYREYPHVLRSSWLPFPPFAR